MPVRTASACCELPERNSDSQVIALTLTNNQYRRYQFEEMKRRRTSGANDGRAGYVGYEVSTGVYSFY
ncbi:hypothetical protein T09_4834 [Trichinella sp. T9]|nr:hypothetical protein T09_4834 [Trichinella sp. T9]